MGLLRGRVPRNLGVQEGKLAPCRRTPNCVSSQNDAQADPGHSVEPLRFSAQPRHAWKALRAVVAGMERVTLKEERHGYLHAEFASKVLGFVDDAEFLLEGKAKVIHVRSAARLGNRDFGVNRKRVETIRGLLEKAIKDERK